MKAIMYKSYGGPSELFLATLPTPSPKPDEVLIKVIAAEASKSDCEMRSFHLPVKWTWLPMRILLGIQKPKRPVLGMYFSGEVLAVGESVKRFNTGDQVFGSSQMKMGAYAEFLCLPETYTLLEKPENMSFEAAAAVPLGGLNALHYLNRAAIKPGEHVLINGAGGSIGTHAVQIAKAMGAEVTAVDSGIKEARLRELGADHFIDYTRENFTEGKQKYDVIFNMVAGMSFSACLKLLKAQGRYLLANPRIVDMLRSTLTDKFGDKQVIFAFAGEKLEELATLKSMIEAGEIISTVDRVYSMADAAEAHTQVEQERRLGTVVIAIGTK